MRRAQMVTCLRRRYGMAEDTGDIMFNRNLGLTANAHTAKNTMYAEKRNEDYYIADCEKGIFLVLDGVSRDASNGVYETPHLVPDVVSTLGKFIYQHISDALDRSDSIDIEQMLREAVSLGNAHIAGMTCQYAFKPGAVGVVCVFRHRCFYYAFIGDCTGLVIREDKTYTEFTENQTDKLHHYIKQNAENQGKRLSKDEIRNEICNNCDSPLGYGVLDGNPRALDFVKAAAMPLSAQDVIVLCTDGIEQYIRCEYVAQKRDLDSAEEIIESSNAIDDARQKRHDDKTLIIIRTGA